MNKIKQNKKTEYEKRTKKLIELGIKGQIRNFFIHTNKKNFETLLKKHEETKKIGVFLLNELGPMLLKTIKENEIYRQKQSTRKNAFINAVLTATNKRKENKFAMIKIRNLCLNLDLSVESIFLEIEKIKELNHISDSDLVSFLNCYDKKELDLYLKKQKDFSSDFLKRLYKISNATQKNKFKLYFEFFEEFENERAKAR